MQQQFSAPQQDQYGNPQQMAQPMMLCPIQYVYETPMLVQPSIQEEQVQPQPYLFNVQNPPPWINRQNVVYVQPNMIYPNMMQNPIYHQQVNYLQQMVVPQEIRHVQMPIQNPEPDKMPVLAQMLKTNQTNLPRPIMQNQQVQTDISSRPQPRPQVITINPMQQRFQKDIRPRQEIPNHIRNKIPSSISVKTIYRPILPRPIRPYEANFYYNNYVVPEQVNTDFAQTVKAEVQNIRPEVQNVKAEVKNVKPEVKTFKNEECQTVKVFRNETVKGKLNQEVTRTFETKVERPPPVAMETQTEEKLLRGTVFVQARGRVLEKDVVINSLKRTLDERLQGNIATNQYSNIVESPKKYIKVEVPQTSLQVNNAKINVPVPTSMSQNQTKPVAQNFNVVKETSEAKLEIKPTNAEINANAKATELDNLKTQLNNFEQKENKHKYSEKVETRNKILEPKQANSPKVKEHKKEAPKSGNICKEELKIKEDKVVVLTHVLDGHIIQESNVAFPIQKLSKEAEKDNSQKSSKSVNIEKHDVIPHLPLSYEHLTKNIEEENTGLTDTDTDSPFANMKKSVVRSWTTEQLADHLSKHDAWQETASKLLEQEIDGESLLLVNKEQLLIIGVCEAHADIVSSFVYNN